MLAKGFGIQHHDKEQYRHQSPKGHSEENEPTFNWLIDSTWAKPLSELKRGL